MDAPPDRGAPKLAEGTRVNIRYVEPEADGRPTQIIDTSGEYRGVFVNDAGYAFVAIKDADDGQTHAPQLWQVERLGVAI